MDSKKLRDFILLQDQAVPRYTSYPTAPYFQPVTDDSFYRKWLGAVPEQEEVSLYVHIPYCTQMCFYCGCHTKATRKYDPVAVYLPYLEKEIALVSAILPDHHVVSHIHFGGGSPGILKANDFQRIMEKIRGHFSLGDNADIAIELDPRLVTEAKVTTYAKSGVTRVSLGVQDFDQNVLKAVNRPQPYKLSYQAVEWMRAYGIQNINLDLIYGLPFQTPETMKKTAENSLFLNPDRMALFGYAHVPWMKKHMTVLDQYPMPDKELRYDLFHCGQKIFRDAGYQNIGIDHFAKESDDLCLALRNRTLNRNFQGYTTDQSKTMIGLGLSSIGQLHNGFVQNALHKHEYFKALDHGVLPVQKKYLYQEEDLMRAEIIRELMCYFEVDLKDIADRHSYPVRQFMAALQSLAKFEHNNILEIDGYRLRVYPEARMIVRLIASAFDTFFQSKKPSEGAAVERQASRHSPRHSKAI